MSESKQFKMQAVDPIGLLDPKPLFTHMTTVEGDVKTVYIAGQVGIDENGELPSTYEGQVKQATKNIEKCLAAANARVSDIVKCNYYIVNYDPDNRPHVPIVLDFFKGHRTATALVPVQSLAKPEFLFEMDAVAVVPVNRGQITVPQYIPTMDTKVDVVVVGGGLSGLQAGYDCQAAGLSTLVLEARDRVGGKTWSVPGAQGKGVVELGGAWTNDTNQSYVYSLAKKLGLDFIQQLTCGDCIMQDLDGTISRFVYGGVPAHSKAEAENMVEIRELVEKLCHQIDMQNPQGPEWDAMTLEEFVVKNGGGPTAQATAKLWTRGLLGVEPRDLSALYFLDYVKSGGGLNLTRSDMKHGGQFLRIRQGTQSLSKGLMSMMKPGSVQLNSPVLGIDQSAGSSGVVVTVEGGRKVLCKRVIVSVPTPLYKEITFSPSLPSDKSKLVSSTTLGWVAKTVVCYASPWWRKQGLSGLASSFNSYVTLFRDTSSDIDDHFSLTCFSQGDTGRAWNKLSAEERHEAVVSHIGLVLGDSSAAAAHIGIFEQRWAPEKWSQGCPCPVMGPGLLGELGHTLRAPFENIHFVGTETAYEWKGYMEGALRSGERGASEVIKILKGE